MFPIISMTEAGVNFAEWFVIPWKLKSEMRYECSRDSAGSPKVPYELLRHSVRRYTLFKGSLERYRSGRIEARLAGAGRKLDNEVPLAASVWQREEIWPPRWNIIIL